MMRRSSVLLYLLVLVSLAFSQTSDEDWYWNKPVAAFQWEGLKYASRAELDSMLREYVGKTFTESLWTDIQAKIYGLDWFDTLEPVAVPASDQRDRVIIRFKVQEKPSVGSIRITGNNALRTSELLSAIKTKSSTIFKEETLREDMVSIQKLYLEKGYPDAAVKYETAIDSADPSRINVSFIISEGAAVTVRRILFTGNASISAQALKSQVKIKEAAFLQSGAFQESKLAESRTAIEEYYRSKGYADAKVVDVLRSYQKDRDANRTSLEITFVISEGRQWSFGGITVEGNEVFSRERILSLVTLKKGDPLNMKRLLADKQKIDDLYYESGYIYNSISLLPSRNEADGSISYRLVIIERDRAHIGSMTFKGNTKTKDYVIAREIPLEEGEVFSKAKIIDGLRNLYNLQYFAAIEPEIYPAQEGNLMDLVIRVEETSTAEIQFGLTLSGLGQEKKFPVSGYVKLNDRNLGGTGRTLQVSTTLSPDEQSLETGFGQNWLFGRRISQNLSFNLSHKLSTTAQDAVAPIFTEEDVPDPFTSASEWNGLLSSVPDQYLMKYDDYSLSMSYSLGYVRKIPLGDIGVGGGIVSGISMASYDAARYRPYEREMRINNGQWILKNSIFGRVYINKLDYWYNPRSGFFLGERLTLTGFLPVEHQHYLKSDTKAEAYFTLFNLRVAPSWTISPVLGIHTGFQALLAQPFGSRTITKDWVYLDGTFSARGWKNLYGSKGVMLWENWLELRLPLVEQAIWFDGFVDAGAMQTERGWVNMTLSAPAAEDETALQWKHFAFSTGFGFRFVIPQFPFRFYFAKRFVFDGSTVTWKTPGADFDFVLSISQPLY
ncbi:MAG: outer membrane protein assembly factor BamA [Rectinemataceae bacterium]